MSTQILTLDPIWAEQPVRVQFHHEPYEAGSYMEPACEEQILIESVIAQPFIKGDAETELIGVLSDTALDDLYLLIERHREDAYEPVKEAA